MIIRIKWLLLSSAFSVFLNCSAHAAVGDEGSSTIKCGESDIPQNVEPLQDLSMPAGTTVEIPAANAFSGNRILYSISALVTNADNVVMINLRNGTIRIESKVPDEFPVTATATSPCGSATVTFNVQVTPAE